MVPTTWYTTTFHIWYPPYVKGLIEFESNHQNGVSYTVLMTFTAGIYSCIHLQNFLYAYY